MWSDLGLMPVRLEWRWLTEVELSTEVILIIAGLLLTAAIYFLGFARLAGKSIRPQRSVVTF